MTHPLSSQALGAAPNAGVESAVPAQLHSCPSLPARRRRPTPCRASGPSQFVCRRRASIFQVWSEAVLGVLSGEAWIWDRGCLQELGGSALCCAEPQEGFQIGTPSTSTSSRAWFSFMVERGLQEQSEFTLCKGTVLSLPTQRRSDGGHLETSREYREVAKRPGTALEVAVLGPGSQQHSLMAVVCFCSFSWILTFHAERAVLPGAELSQEMSGP